MASMEKPLRLTDLDDVELTASQGFRALTKFLTAFFEQTSGNGVVRTLVGDVELESYGTSTDPAALSDWLKCVEDVLAEDGRAAVETGLRP